MKNLFREGLRRLAHLPMFGHLAARVEDGIDHARLAGTSARRASSRRQLSACRTAEDYLAYIRPLLPPSQIDSEIIALLGLAAAHQVRRVLEIGTAQGGTTFLLSRSIPTVEWTTSIDLCPRHTSVLRFFNEPARTFHSLAGSSRDPKILQSVTRLLGGIPLDLLFIDGDHSYEGVAADFQSYRPFLRQGGLVVFHDIVEASDTGSPTSGHRWVGGVPRFWNEVKTRGLRSWEFVENRDQGGFGIGVIEIGSLQSLDRHD